MEVHLGKDAKNGGHGLSDKEIARVVREVME